MKKFSITALSALMILGGLTQTTGAWAEDLPVVSETVIKSNEVFHSFYFDQIKPGQSVGVRFNAGMDNSIAVRRLYVAAYDQTNFSMAMVEANLEQLGAGSHENKPEWASVVVEYEMPKIFGGMTTGGFTTRALPKLANNNVGVLYYALEYFNADESDESQWYRGKIDYRACAYTPDTPYASHVSLTCKGRLSGDGKTMIFSDEFDESLTVREDFVPWSKELGDSLRGELSGLASNIESWEGDEWQKEQFLASLKRIENLAVDADDMSGIKTEVERLRGLLNKTEEPEAPEITVPVVTPGGGSGRRPSSWFSESIDLNGAEKVKDNIVVADTPNEESTEQLETSYGEVANNRGTVLEVSRGETDEKEEEKEVRNDDGVTTANEMVEVPALSGDEIVKASKWSWWWIVFVLIGLIAGIAWWLKRAFWQTEKRK